MSSRQTVANGRPADSDEITGHSHLPLQHALLAPSLDCPLTERNARGPGGSELFVSNSRWAIQDGGALRMAVPGSVTHLILGHQKNGYFTSEKMICSV